MQNICYIRVVKNHFYVHVDYVSGSTLDMLSMSYAPEHFLSLAGSYEGWCDASQAEKRRCTPGASSSADSTAFSLISCMSKFVRSVELCDVDSFFPGEDLSVACMLAPDGAPASGTSFFADVLTVSPAVSVASIGVACVSTTGCTGLASQCEVLAHH